MTFFAADHDVVKQLLMLEDARHATRDILLYHYTSKVLYKS